MRYIAMAKRTNPMLYLSLYKLNLWIKILKSAVGKKLKRFFLLLNHGITIQKAIILSAFYL